MKKLRNILLLCLIVIVATGCVKFNAIMTIKKDKSMDFTIIYALDKTMMGELGSLKEEQFEDLKEDGYSVEKYTEGNYEGFKITKKIKNIDEVSSENDVLFDLSGMMEETDNNKYMFKVVKNGEKNTYYAKLKFDSNSSDLNDDEDTTDDEILPDEDEDLSITSSDDDMDLSALTNNMDLSFKVELPNSAISSNATTKENNDKTLSWKLKYGQSQTIEFAFEIDPNAKDDSNILLYACIGGGVLLLAIIIVVIVSTSKKRKKAPIPQVVTLENKENKE